MSTVVETENDNKVALAALEQGATDAPLTTDGADDGELERELTQMEADADRLQKEGVISTDDANMKRAEVAKTRKLFRDLPAAERIAIIKRRREIGRQLLERQLSGAAVVTARVRLNHTRLKPLFEQWWPYINRMSINMQRFGRSTFGENDKEVVNSALEKLLAGIEGYVDEQLRVAEGFRQQKEAELRANKEFVFEPTIPMPAMDIEVEAYSRFSMRVLSVDHEVRSDDGSLRLHGVERHSRSVGRRRRGRQLPQDASTRSAFADI